MADKKDLLLEIGTEELPPKSLATLAAAMAAGMRERLQDKGLAHGDCSWLATPRRLAVIVRDLAVRQADKRVEKRGPALAAAYDQDGKPTAAAAGFARSCGVAVEDLDTLETDQGGRLVHRFLDPGAAATELLPEIARQALAGLPIARRMRWGDGAVEFVRPAHWAVLLFGRELIRTTLLGVETDRRTRGHRFHRPRPIRLATAGDYEEKLTRSGRVIPGFEARKARIRQAVIDAATKCGGRALLDEELLEETTALAEWPVAVAGAFDEAFLELPKEILVAALQTHQKCFPVKGRESEQLIAAFITVANVESPSPDTIRRGHERVIRPRLDDAAFFWERDNRQPLDKFSPRLERVVFQQQLGSLADKTARLVRLGRRLAQQAGIGVQRVERAAQLSKCDLVTDVVGEFPELEGVMGYYYAMGGGEDPEVSVALEEQYMPRRAGAELPQSGTGKILALADRLDALAGIFAVGKAPSGDKDPFGLRRAALGCLRILIECALPLDLEESVRQAAAGFPDDVNAGDAAPAVLAFVLERLRRYYADQGVDPHVFDAVQACRPTRPHDFNLRISAVQQFLQLPEAKHLAAANKRIGNLLKQAQHDSAAPPDERLFKGAAETGLYRQMQSCGAEEHIRQGDYGKTLAALAGLRDGVNAFFDQVMVLCDDEKVRNNRLALLSELRRLFLTVADISRLPG